MSETLHADSLQNRSFRNRRYAFTLIEVLAVIALVAMLAALLLPAIQQSRESARRTLCANNLTQIGLALANYVMAHDILPPGSQAPAGPIQSVEGGGYHMGWLTQILPFIEQQNVYGNIDFTRSAYDPRNVPVRQQMISLYVCPSESNSKSTGIAQSNYCGVHNDIEAPIDVNQNGVLFLNSSIGYDEIGDGISNTLFVVESRLDMGISLGWMTGTRSTLRNLVRTSGNRPLNDENGKRLPSDSAGLLRHPRSPYDDLSASLQRELSQLNAGREYVGGPGSHHSNGIMNLLFGDGSVRPIWQELDLSVLRKLAHRRDGEMMNDF